ncbi:DHH family phosphoesterase [Campylobacter sp. VicNov18]|uniref:DHH family phosphoesterase n=1 Tax=Campylobacter bilis TaxID=2691918 RepID=UPI00130E300C|nr:DHH family phosphoesterase [Campylobacter bilis]MPV63530.1 3'-to-5' oligoribonuclease B [Campylobacter hepaticus]MBM0637030.1 3'-to-5' oligoribonuclease B [Campylobacter bilis]MCC8277814.1 DHH family phosphoesterase [Campylobacter bilis]MCC8299423.1 DHH family phosphoesterase [Campylobacter bilis]MCC8300723.1 DHH family phosphoesterase [Campylobacter bilis]
MKIYHLSHTDLDGYACQFVVDFYFKNVQFYNSNYGKEINENFNTILNDIEKDNNFQKAIILITDLNLNPSQCEEFDRICKEKNIKIFLLDHHQSGEECAQKYSWYLLDSKRCATKIVYDFFSKICRPDLELSKLVDVVNAVDIWLCKDENFELGKVFLGLIVNAKEINRVMFKEMQIAYMFFLINKAREFIGKNNANVLLDNAIHFIKKDFFMKDNDNTLSNLISYFVVEKLGEHKEKFTIEYEGHKGILTSNIGNTSIIGNDFLVKNPDYDFFIDVSSKKTLSFRANGKIDVSLMAKNLVGGGGHKNASGGLFAAFKDGSNYNHIKTQIMDLIKSKELKKENNVSK